MSLAWLCFFLLSSLALVACGQIFPAPTPIVIPLTPHYTATITPTPSLTPSRTPTPTPSPTASLPPLAQRIQTWPYTQLHNAALAPAGQWVAVSSPKCGT